MNTDTLFRGVRTDRYSMCVYAQITDTVIQANTHKEFPYEQISNLKLIMNKTMTDKRNLEEPYYFSFGWLLVLHKKSFSISLISHLYFVNNYLVYI